MAVGETQTQKHRRKMPSFSSSLLDAIYHSIDEPHHHHSTPHRRNAAHAGVDEEIESLRRAIMIEKWMANYTNTTTAAASSRHLPSNSGSSTDSSCMFTASETDSSTPRPVEPPLNRFNRTKSRALKIYGDLKKAKEPISPGGRIATFLNFIFSPRNSKREKINPDWSSVRKSRSMKDTTTAAGAAAVTNSSSASRSCLINNANSSSRSNKSKRSVRFCPVSVNILDERGHGDGGASMAAGAVGSRYIKKNIESIRLYENEREFDDKSCASSDLFELENIGGNYEAELPVYGTTHLRMNRAISSRH